MFIRFQVNNIKVKILNIRYNNRFKIILINFLESTIELIIDLQKRYNEFIFFIIEGNDKYKIEQIEDKKKIN